MEPLSSRPGGDADVPVPDVPVPVATEPGMTEPGMTEPGVTAPVAGSTITTWLSETKNL